MGQVPENKTKYPYLIVGNGNLASHFHHYFNLLGIPHHHWWRQSSGPFQSLLEKSERVLVLISDNAISSFIQDNRSADDARIWIHCSGILSLPSVESAHPLLSFSDHLYKLEMYKKIPFVVEKSSRSFEEIFPGINNPHCTIPSDLKPLYHAWCVMSGNFSTILWEKFVSFLEEYLHQPRSFAYPYYESIGQNLTSAKMPLTGPFARKDFSTIEKHLKALSNEPFLEIYQAFNNIFNNS
jgi:predicted short-subunit dehydrogenase-like oxidoreductase (DUF2520 family)